ncbi:hypothetical protein STXM2123_4205 [Streptomyces sp. F-3]|nr:hypothetical protein STXM2123_4205 [Streptomyces sp. F-3]
MVVLGRRGARVRVGGALHPAAVVVRPGPRVGRVGGVDRLHEPAVGVVGVPHRREAAGRVRVEGVHAGGAAERVGEDPVGGGSVRVDDLRPVLAVLVAGGPLRDRFGPGLLGLLVHDLEDGHLLDHAAESVVLVTGDVGDGRVGDRGEQHTRLGLVGQVGVVGLPDLTGAVVQRVGDQVPAAVGLLLCLPLAAESVVEGDGGLHAVLVPACVGGDVRRFAVRILRVVRRDCVDGPEVRHGRARRGAARGPGLDETAQRVVLRLAHMAVGVGRLEGGRTARLQLLRLGVAEGVGLRDREDLPGRRGVGDGGGLAVRVGLPDHTAEGVKVGGPVGLEAGAVAVQRPGLGGQTACGVGERGTVGAAVVRGAGGAAQAAQVGEVGLRAQGRRDQHLLGQTDEVLAGVVDVFQPGAGLVPGLSGVAEGLHLGGQAVRRLIGRLGPHDPLAAGVVTGAGGLGVRDLHRLRDTPGVQRAQAVVAVALAQLGDGRNGDAAGQPVGVRVVRVRVGELLGDTAGECLVVLGDLGAGDVLDRDVVAQAAEEAGDGLGLLAADGRVVLTRDHRGLREPGELRVGARGLLGELVLGELPPGVLVRVRRLGAERAVDVGEFLDGLHHVLVEPVDVLDLGVRVPERRVAQAGVGLQRRRVLLARQTGSGGAVTGGLLVGDDGLAAVLVDDTGDAQPGETGTRVIGPHDPVGHVLRVGLEAHRVEGDALVRAAAAGVPGPLDRLQPQGGVRAGPQDREALRERVLVHHLARGVVLEPLCRGGDRDQALAGPERRAGVPALLAGLAPQVGRGVVPDAVPARVLVGEVLLRAGQAALVEAALADLEADAGRSLLGEEGVPALPVVDVGQVAVAVVGDRRLEVEVAGVVVLVALPPQGHGVAVDVLDVVESPAPGLGAPRAGPVAGLVAVLTGMVAVHRHGQDGVGDRVAFLPVRQLVQTEVVAGAVTSGDDPVLAVPGTVAALVVLDLLDPGAVAVGGEPLALVLVPHQLGGRAAEGQGRVVRAPAQVGRAVRGVVRPGLLGVLAAVGVGTGDGTRVVVPAVADPRGLVVGGGGAAVDRLRGVAQRHLGHQAAGGLRYLDLVRVGEGARGGAGRPGARGQQRRRGEVTGGGRAGVHGADDLRTGGVHRLQGGGTDGGAGRLRGRLVAEQVGHRHRAGQDLAGGCVLRGGGPGGRLLRRHHLHRAAQPLGGVGVRLARHGLRAALGRAVAAVGRGQDALGQQDQAEAVGGLGAVEVGEAGGVDGQRDLRLGVGGGRRGDPHDQACDARFLGGGR